MSTNDRLQHTSLKQLKIEVDGIFKKEEEIILNFEPSHHEVIPNKLYLDTKLVTFEEKSKVNGHLSLIEKIFMEWSDITNHKVPRPSLKL